MYFHHFRHLGRHLEFLNTLNDDRLSSSRILNGNVLPTRIHQEKNFIPDFQVHRKYAIFVPDYYRGITLSSCFGKLFCHVLNERILKYIDNISFLRPEHAGFRKHFRTTDHIYVLKTIVDKYVFNLTKGGEIYACFIDFDTVWHDGLLLKLQKLELMEKCIASLNRCTKDLCLG